jgi:cytochrome o ubiquinol oxidase subunit 2
MIIFHDTMKSMIKAFMRVLSLGVVIFLALYLVNYMGTHNMGILNPKGIIAYAEKDLMFTAVFLMLIVVIPVFGMLFGFVWRYREGNTNKNVKYTPEWSNNIVLEVIWWLIPSVIIVVLSVITWRSTHDLDPFRPLSPHLKPVTIQVVALNWKWLFIYPEEHIATVNYIAFPKDTPINFVITADAPMNAFWIPQLGTQIYAMPGMSAKLHLMADEAGDYQGVSSNFSGDGFSGMKFIAHATSEEEYKAWLANVRASTSTLTLATYKDIARASKDNPVMYYSSVIDSLYTDIIATYMGNMKHLHDSHGMDMNTDTMPDYSRETVH